MVSANATPTAANKPRLINLPPIALAKLKAPPTVSKPAKPLLNPPKFSEGSLKPPPVPPADLVIV